MEYGELEYLSELHFLTLPDSYAPTAGGLTEGLFKPVCYEGSQPSIKKK